MNRPPVTVFGGSGFIGRRLVKRLAAKGFIVRVAVRDPEAANFLKPMGDVGQIVPLRTDITDPKQVVGAVEGAEAVFNLVGILSQWGGRTFPRLHVKGAANVAQAAQASGVKRLIHVSALGAADDSPSIYAMTKAAGEQAVKEAFPQATIVRPSVVFGPEDNFFNLFAGLARLTPVLPVFGCPFPPRISLFGAGEDGSWDLFDMLKVDFYGDGGTRLQPVYVGDVGDAMMAILADHETTGKTFELGGPKIYSFKEIMELMLSQVGRQRFLAPVPFALARFYAWFLEKWPKPLLTRDQLRLLESDNVVSEGALTLKDLGIKETPVETVLPTYLHRFRIPQRQDLRIALR